MRHRLVLFVDKKEDRLDTFVCCQRQTLEKGSKEASKRMKIFFSSFPHFVASLQNSKQYYKQLSLRILLSLLLLKTFAEFKKTNTLANCKDREKERGGRALS